MPRFIDALMAGACFAIGSRFVAGAGSGDITPCAGSATAPAASEAESVSAGTAGLLAVQTTPREDRATGAQYRLGRQTFSPRML